MFIFILLLFIFFLINEEKEQCHVILKDGENSKLILKVFVYQHLYWKVQW